MIITTAQNNVLIGFSYLNNYPDPFVSEKKKLEDTSYIKNTMDYFANMAYTQYRNNRETFVKNYDLLKGMIDKGDFYQDVPEVRDFLDTLSAESGLPAYVKHYSLINQPVNAMIGELTKRPDVHRVRAFDDDSRAEELEYKTSILQNYILQNARKVITNKLAISGQDVSKLTDDQLQEMTFASVKDLITSYTSVAESWGNHMLTSLKALFNTKEKSEDAFRDQLIAAREFFHIYEDNTKLGFNTRVENPKNVWWKGTPDTKYTSAISGEPGTPYCIGTVYVKEISEIIDEVAELSMEEIEHLKKGVQNSLLLSGRESNLFSGKEGIDSIQYDTYNRLIWQERMLIQSEIGNDNNDDLKHWLGASNAFSFGYKYVVIRAYWNSKKKVGQLTYLDENGDEQTTLVDESYKEGSPNEINIEWGWVNQWYQGIKIGPDIYHVKPYKLLDYSPIIGLIYESKNTVAKSLVDLMKPLQVLFNIAMNKIYELLEKEIGNVGVINVRRIPRAKSGDENDSLDILEDDMRNRGILLDDDSPENTKGATSNTSIARNVDLSRSNEIQSKYNLASQLQDMAWQLIGMNRQRLGSPQATETATANNNALVQSYAQTEPYFAAHDYVMNQYYQALLDAAKYIESTKPLSTVNYVTSQGENAFIQVGGEDISLRDLKVLVTSRPEDQQLFNEFRQLSQAAMQNGASLYEISQLYTTQSLRQMQKVFKDLADKNDQYKQQEQQLQQQQLQQQQEEMKAENEQKERFHEDEMSMKKYEVDVKSSTDITKAEIATYFQAPSTDSDGDGQPDILEIANHQQKISEALAKNDLEKAKLSLELQKFQADQKIKKKQLVQADQKIANEKERNQIMKNKPKASK